MHSSEVNHLAQNVSDMSLDSSQNGEWEKVAGKNKNGAGSNAAKQWVPNNLAPVAWCHPDTARKLWRNNGLGKGPMRRWNGQNSNPGGQGRPHSVPAPQNVPPPLEHGWNWVARAGGSSQLKTVGPKETNVTDIPQADGDDDDTEVYSDDDDDILSDGFESDESVRSFETWKKHRLLKTFFEEIDKLTVEEINNPTRQWHHPACRNGPGAIDWYKGLQPLAKHAKTKGSKRFKLHQELAVLLEEELKGRGTSIIPSGESFGQWEGLRKETRDYEIVWPPMLVILNTR